MGREKQFNPSSDKCPLCGRLFKNPDCPHTVADAIKSLLSKQNRYKRYAEEVVREVVRQELERDVVVSYKSLHQNLDRLLAAYIAETGSMPSTTSVMDLLQWSHKKAKSE